MKKRFQQSISFLCACCLLLACAVPAFAVSEPTTEEYAYMSTDTASPQLKEKILAARYEIIHAPDARWSVDGNVYVTHADGTTEVLPKFSDVYPDWNLTEISASQEFSYATGIAPYKDLVPNLWDDEPDYYFYDTVRLAVTTASSYFCSFNAKGTEGRVRAVTLPGERWNAAVWNEDAHREDAYMPNMTKTDYLTFTTKNNVRYSVRASSPDKAGDATILVAVVE